MCSLIARRSLAGTTQHFNPEYRSQESLSRQRPERPPPADLRPCAPAKEATASLWQRHHTPTPPPPHHLNTAIAPSLLHHFPILFPSLSRPLAGSTAARALPATLLEPAACTGPASRASRYRHMPRPNRLDVKDKIPNWRIGAARRPVRAGRATDLLRSSPSMAQAIDISVSDVGGRRQVTDSLLSSLASEDWPIWRRRPPPPVERAPDCRSQTTCSWNWFLPGARPGGGFSAIVPGRRIWLRPRRRRAFCQRGNSSRH